MTQIVPLSSQKHLHFKLAQSTDYSRFSTQHLIPVVAREIPNLAAEFPIVFVKNSETGQFTPVAMMGIKPKINLYCQSAKWHSPVTPLGFSNAPLSIAKTSAQSDELIICIDEQSPLLSQHEGIRLFTDNGEQTDYLIARTNALMDIAALHQQTQAICQYLADKNLLSPQQLTIKGGEDVQHIKISGVYVIDDENLNAISDDDFLALKNKGLLPLIYAHRASLNQLARLIAEQNKYDSPQ